MENVPANLVAGDTWEWTRELADYPAGTWTLTYFLSRDGKKFSFAATADGTSHSVSVAAATTADYQAGRYFWQGRVVSGSEAFTVEEGWVEVQPNPASTANADPRSWARRTLDAVECFLEGNASTAQASMTIQGRSLSRWSIAELMQFRDKLRQEVRVEEQGSRAGLGRDIKVRFGRG